MPSEAAQEGAYLSVDISDGLLIGGRSDGGLRLLVPLWSPTTALLSGCNANLSGLSLLTIVRVV
jgi:hypothetical protein